MAEKEEVRVFVSYASSNKRIVGQLIDRFEEQTKPSKRYDYIFWVDWDILVGETWADEIEDALKNSTLGLMLISPAFLASQFITEQELPVFVGSTDKAIIPVMLQPVNLDRHDLKGLKSSQIFQLDSDRFRKPKALGECTSSQRDRFAEKLFDQVEARLDRYFGK